MPTRLLLLISSVISYFFIRNAFLVCTCTLVQLILISVDIVVMRFTSYIRLYFVSIIIIIPNAFTYTRMTCTIMFIPKNKIHHPGPSLSST